MFRGFSMLLIDKHVEAEFWRWHIRGAVRNKEVH